MNTSKKTIFFDITGDKKWIGGLYYLRNIIYSILENEQIRKKYKLLLLVDNDNKELFEVFAHDVKIICVESGNKLQRQWNTLRIFCTCQVAYIYKYHHYKFDLINILESKGIYWVADFQEKHFPLFFSEKELKFRDNRISQILRSPCPLVLSSQDALNDVKKFYPTGKNNIFVIPFVSYIEPEILSLDEKYEREVMNKYNIEKKQYIFIANQFWQHKNHIVVFKTIKLLIQQNLIGNYKFVFTGEPKDRRNESYYTEVMSYVEDTEIFNVIKILGFINRKEQLVLMKNSKLIIQPSLFEGWGTVLEDAKVLDKIVLLSDIPVHREQMNNNCLLFDSYSPSNLLSIMLKALRIEHVDNVDKGIIDMHTRAKEYSHVLEKIFR